MEAVLDGVPGEKPGNQCESAAAIFPVATERGAAAGGSDRSVIRDIVSAEKQ
jgi:hypothetical protein